jgi:tetratricopeptide (TPR) repeat protein
LSWQTTVIGDPLYRPFGKTPRDQHDALERSHSKLLEWADLRYADESMVLGLKPAEVVEYLVGPGVPQDSAVLAEKLADLYQIDNQDELSIKAFRRALQLDPTPQQMVRLTLHLADRLIATGHEDEALSLYDDFLKKSPDYPATVALYSKMETLAIKLSQTRRAERYAREISKLTAGK